MQGKSLTTSHKQTDAQPVLSKGHHGSQTKNPFLYLNFLLLSMTLHGIEFLFDQSGSAVQAVSLPNFLHPSQPAQSLVGKRTG